MRIPFKLIDETVVDLAVIPKFQGYYQDKTTYLPLIIKLFEDGCYKYLKGQPLNTVVDLGGNVGLFSLYVSPIAKTIYTVEPDPKHFEICSNTLSKTKQVLLYNLAISNTAGTTTFFRSSWNSSGNTIVPNSLGTLEEVTVKTNTLYNIIKDTEIDYVKMDIEGGEKVIYNDPTFPFENIKQIEISVHPVYGVDINMILSKLNEKGFKCTVQPSECSPIILGVK